MISKTIAKITDNFEKGYEGSTMMAWYPDFDKEGRPLNANPNYRTGRVQIEGETYVSIRKGWEVRIYKQKGDYMDFLNNRLIHIDEIDLTPEYLWKNTL